MLTNDKKFANFIDDVITGDFKLSDLLTSDIVELGFILDAELQERAYYGVDINDRESSLFESWVDWEQMDFAFWSQGTEEEWEE
jgi:hypothetical protein